MASDWRTPMKAGTLPALTQLRLPVYGSPKLDGFRCRIIDGIAYTKNHKPFRNEFVQDRIGIKALSGLDGELIVGDPRDNKTSTVLGRSAAVMSIRGEPDFTYHVFDRFDRPDRPFKWRLGSAEDLIDDYAHRKPLVLVEHQLLETLAAATTHEANAREQGYEGTCYRDPLGRYKNGRSTTLEGLLLKFKRFVDGEARVTKLIEGRRNENEAIENEQGKKQRSAKAEGMALSGLVGTIVAVTKAGKEMNLAPGTMTAEDRARYMANPKLLIGQWVTWRAFDYGVKDAVRFAHFHGIRDKDDL